MDKPTTITISKETKANFDLLKIETAHIKKDFVGNEELLQRAIEALREKNNSTK